MTNAKRLYSDYHAFWKRFSRYLKKGGHTGTKYIAAEPQGRGAWHLHCLFLLTERAPFIPNTEMARIWSHGFTKTQSLKGISNPGLYLTAYLGDMKVTEAIQAGTFRDGRLTETKDKRKAVVKGGRLKLHPVGFNLYRCSHGIKRPEIWQTTEEQVQEEIIGKVLAYEKTVSITDESGTQRNIINYHTCCNLPSEETGTFTTEDREIFDAGSG